jgi:hypothetical protein
VDFWYLVCIPWKNPSKFNPDAGAKEWRSEKSIFRMSGALKHFLLIEFYPNTLYSI